MTAPAQALIRLSQGDKLFHSDRAVYAPLVMAGLARCYVVRGGDEYVRLATDEERAIHTRYSARAEKARVR
jgi:hypothetical protein